MPPIETSPYSAMTAMALDPIYISMASVADFAGLGAELALDGAEQAEIKRLRQSPRIDYASIRRLKDRWLRRSFDRFLRLEVVARHAARRCGSTRSSPAQSWWLEEYAVFRALHARCTKSSPWTRGPSRWRARDAARDRRSARRSLRWRSPIASYLQWIAAEQWAEAKRLSWPVRVFRRSAVHDLRQQPRRVGAAARVPLRRHDRRAAGCVQRNRAGLGPAAMARRRDGAQRLRLDARASAAATAISTTAIASITSSACIACTSGRSTRPCRRSSIPADEAQQIELGETLIGMLRGAPSRGPKLIAEDLGSIPPFVRESMARLDLPGPEGAALGAALGSRRAAADRSRRSSRALRRHHRHARHRAAGGDAGRSRPTNSAPRCCSRCCRPARA